MLTVSNLSGQTPPVSRSTVNVSAIAAPVASFTSDGTTGSLPLTVRFTDTSTNSPTSWAWNFGDGSTSAQQNPMHVYFSGGRLTVTLTATNSGGSQTVTSTNYIIVTAIPTATLTTVPATLPVT